MRCQPPSYEHHHRRMGSLVPCLHKSSLEMVGTDSSSTPRASTPKLTKAYVIYLPRAQRGLRKRCQQLIVLHGVWTLVQHLICQLLTNLVVRQPLWPPCKQVVATTSMPAVGAMKCTWRSRPQPQGGCLLHGELQHPSSLRNHISGHAILDPQVP